MNDPYIRKTEVAEKLKIRTLLLLMDIASNPGITYLQLRANYTSDGSLSTHTKLLEQKKLITIVKQYEGKRPRTLFYISKDGQKYLDAFREIFEEYILTRYNLNN